MRAAPDFVTRGGSLVATYETSLYDEWGVERSDFGLADLFGVSFAGRREGPMQNSYLRLEHETAPGHPLLAGLEDAPRIINGVWQLEVEAAGAVPESAADADSRRIPTCRWRRSTPRAPRPTCRRSSCARLGAGRVVYFPWDIDRTFWEVLAWTT